MQVHSHSPETNYRADYNSFQVVSNCSVPGTPHCCAQPPHKVGITVPRLQVRELRLSKIKQLAQGHTLSK